MPQPTSPPDMQDSQATARQVASTQQLKPMESATEMQNPSRGPKEAQHQTPAARTRPYCCLSVTGNIS